MAEETPAEDLAGLLGQYISWSERRYCALTEKLCELARKGSLSREALPFLHRQLILKGSTDWTGNDTDDDMTEARDQAAFAIAVLAERGVCDPALARPLVKHLIECVGKGSGGHALKAMISQGALSALDIVAPFNKTVAAGSPKKLGPQHSAWTDAILALRLLARNGIGHASSLEGLYPCVGDPLQFVREAAEETVSLLNGLGIGSADEARRRMAGHHRPGLYDEFK